MAYDESGITPTSIYSFGGLNRTKKASRNEFADMGNMSSREYPCLAPRTKHEAVFSTNGAIQCAVAPDPSYADSIEGLTGIADEKFYYNGIMKSKDIVLSKDMQWEIKKVARSDGLHYIIHGYDPAEKLSVLYWYTPETDGFTRMGVIMDDLIVIAGTDSDGRDYLKTFRYGYSSLKDYTVETDGKTIDCGRFFAKYGVSTHGYNTLSSDQNVFEQYFKYGDAVDISGFPTADQSVGQVFRYKGTDEAIVPITNVSYSYNNTYDADSGISDPYCITAAYVDGFDISTVSVQGIQCPVHKVYLRLLSNSGETLHFDSMEGNGTQPNSYCCGITLSSLERAYTSIEIHNSRVWGASPDGQQIFASASDILYDVSDASITGSNAVGSANAGRIRFDIPGGFTGLCEFRDYVFAFKENCVGIIYGDNPSNYGITLYPWTGCIDRRSIAVTRDGVIYLSHSGFYRFDGTTAVCISDKLNRRYKAARSCFDGSIYYTLAIFDFRSPDGSTGEACEILAYDTRYGTWHGYDTDQTAAAEAVGSGVPISDIYYNMFSFHGELYLLFHNRAYHKTDITDHTVSWHAISSPITDDDLDRKSVNEIWIYADIAEGAYFTVYTITDGDGPVEHTTFTTPGTHVFRCPVRALNCTSYQYRIAGQGEVVIREIEIRKYKGNARRYKERV